MNVKAPTILLVMLMLALVGTKPPPATASHLFFTLEDLGVLPGQSSSRAVGINDLGQVVGRGVGSAFVYTDGPGMVELATPDGYPFGCSAEAINNGGWVVGYCGLGIGDQPKHAVRWTPAGAPEVLGTLGGPNSAAHGINDAGAIVGQSDTGDFLPQAFGYTDALGMNDLTPGDGLSIAHDINDNPAGAQITGYENNIAFRWQNGALTLLGTPDGHDYSFGFGMNDLGTVVGASKILQTDISHMVRFTDRAGWEVFTSHGQQDKLWAVNNDGVIVGVGKPFPSPVEHSVIHTDEDGMQLLNDLTDASDTWSVTSALDINERGQVAGQAMNISTGEFHAVRLTPICQINCVGSALIQLVGGERNGTIGAAGRVVVQDENGAAVTGAAVDVIWSLPDGSTVARSATSNQNGFAHFIIGAGAGSYTLTVSDIDFAGASFDVAGSHLTESVTAP